MIQLVAAAAARWSRRRPFGPASQFLYQKTLLINSFPELCGKIQVVCSNDNQLIDRQSFRSRCIKSSSALVRLDGFSMWNSNSFEKIGSKNVIQIRQMSSWLPEAMQGISVWGGAGWMLKMLHMDGTIPYWACFAIINFMLRTALLPVVVYGARSMARFGKVSPEIQFIVTLFQNDLKRMQAEGRSLYERRLLFQTNLRTVRDIYKLHGIHPMAVFLSPLIQIPVFYYISVDLRKIVNGADPALAQQLIDCPIGWITDLTEPDPWYGLPIAAGIMLYLNVEVAVGKRSLAGPAPAKSDFGMLLKDGFQTLAVFMPAFASQSPAGIQIYLLSSFMFTLFQSAALRTNAIRTLIGLPLMGAPPIEPKYAKEFLEFKKLEQKARILRGDGPVLGRNVLAAGFETSFAGTNRPSTIKGSGQKYFEPPPLPIIGGEARAMLTGSRFEAIQRNRFKLDIGSSGALGGGPFIHGISAPIEQLEAQFAEQLEALEEKEKKSKSDALRNPTVFSRHADPSRSPEELMEAANKGVIFAPAAKDRDQKSVERLSSKKLSRNTKNSSKRKGNSQRKR